MLNFRMFWGAALLTGEESRLYVALTSSFSFPLTTLSLSLSLIKWKINIYVKEELLVNIKVVLITQSGIT